MKQIKTITIVFISLLTLVSCGKSVNLSKDMLKDKNGYEALKEKVYSKYPNLKDEPIELMEFSFSASISTIKNKKSSMMSFTMVKGDNKNSIIKISLDNEGFESSDLVNITTGTPGKERKVKSYEKFKSALFPEKIIDINVLREVRKKAKERFKKDANSETAYCTNLSIERGRRNNQPKISVTIREEKPLSKLHRSYYYTLKGEKTNY